MRQTFRLSLLGIGALMVAQLCGCKEELPRKPIPLPASPAELQRPGRGGMRAPMASPSRSSGGNAAAGLVWKIPRGWRLGRRRPMRLATYIIPPQGSSQKGECSVFYFGPRGGGVQANIDRWRKQFKFASPQVAANNVKVRKVNIAEIKVTEVRIQGTFMSSVRPMSPTKIAKPNHVMLGSIVQGPRGPVFFKCVGPTATMTQATGAFRQMMASLKKGGA